MIEGKERLLVFGSFLVLALAYWRMRVFLFYSDGKFPFLRVVTGLKIHHYHYGIFIILIALLSLVFLKKNSFSVALAGFGLGTVFDSLISGLFKSSSRMDEIINYHNNFYLTVFVFMNIIVLSLIFYFAGERGKL